MHRVLAVMAVLAALCAIPAASWGDGGPLIVAPASGDVVASGWTGPFSVDFENAEDGDYTLQVSGGGYSWSDQVEVDDSTGTVTVAPEPVNDPGTYTAAVLDGDGNTLTQTSFSVARPQATLEQPRAGGVYAAGYTGPVSVDFSGALPGSYHLSVVGPGYQWQRDVQVSAQTTTVSAPIDPADGTGSYTATVTSATGELLASAVFRVAHRNAAVFQEPSAGASFGARTSVSVAVLWRGVWDPAAAYAVRLWRDGSRRSRTLWQGGGSGLEGRTTQVRTGRLTPGRYTLRALELANGDVAGQRSFTVRAVPVPLRFSGRDLRPRAFYPLVRDGYRDAAVLHFQLSRTARAVIQVRRHGRLVARAQLGWLRGGEIVTWRWRGRNRHGRLVRPGRYTITVGARAGRRAARWSTRVRVRTAVLRHRVTKVDLGGRPTSTGSRRHCRIRHGARGSLTLSCHGGRYAAAGYRFTVPRRARRLRWRVNGVTGCCRPGRTLQTTHRHRNRFWVYVYATGWRSYHVVSVSVRYTLRRRI